MTSSTKFFILTFLVLVNLQFNLGKPYSIDRMMCDFLCEDDNGDNTTVDPDDMWDVFCNSCPSTRPRPRTTTLSPIPLGAIPANMPNIPPPPNNGNFPNAPRGMPGGPPPMGFVIYPSNGMNVTMTPTDGFYTWSFIPWMSQQNQQTTTPSPPATTEAPTTAATTAAAATTTAASSTTEGSTTAAA